MQFVYFVLILREEKHLIRPLKDRFVNSGTMQFVYFATIHREGKHLIQLLQNPFL